MSLSIEVLFGNPQHEVASLTRQRLAQSTSAHIVVGFATPEGIGALEPHLHSPSTRLQTLVVGAGTYKAYEALDQLLGHGISPDNLLVHLGHTRPLGKTTVHLYHPMLHSKIYYLEMPNGDACAFIGSHNMSGFALLGKNGEAAVMIEGPRSDHEFEKIRAHISEARRQAVPYSPSMKDALTWWTGEFVNGLWRKVNDNPDDSENDRTILILAEMTTTIRPKKGEIIYFELPEALSKLRSLESEVHVFAFDRLPSSPAAALASLDNARYSLWCKTRGLETKRGGRELQADWEVANRTRPVLRQTSKPFRPSLTPDMQQVRVEVYREVRDRYEYLFDRGKTDWHPEYDAEEKLTTSAEQAEFLRRFKLDPPEDGEWRLVRGLVPAEPRQTERSRAALRETSPQSGSFILFSLRRRSRDRQEDCTGSP